MGVLNDQLDTTNATVLKYKWEEARSYVVIDGQFRCWKVDDTDTFSGLRWLNTSAQRKFQTSSLNCLYVFLPLTRLLR